MSEKFSLSSEQTSKDLGENDIEDEDVESKKFEVIQIPSIEDERGSDMNLVKEDPKKISQVEKNLEYLEGLIPLIIEKEDKHNKEWLEKNEDNNSSVKYKINDRDKNHIVNVTKIWRENFEYYKKRIEGYKKASDVQEIIPNKIENLKKIDDKKISTLEEIGKNLKNNFENIPGNKICLADSHLHTINSLTEAHNARVEENSKTAVIVFDNHVDMQDSINTDHERGDWKGNVFQKLFKNSSIDRATFVGGHAAPVTMDRNNRELNKSDETVFDQINADDIRTNDKLDRPKLVQKISNAIDKHKESGVTNLVFSVDIDVLRVKQMGYTAMEYTPMNSLGFLGGLDLPLDKKYSDLSDKEIKNIKESMQHNVQDGHNRTNLAAYGERTDDPEGMTLGDIGVSLAAMAEKCKKLGITLGIKLTGGGTYLGDVVELAGADYGERTTKATAALIKRINKISDSLDKESEKPKQ